MSAATAVGGHQKSSQAGAETVHPRFLSSLTHKTPWDCSCARYLRTREAA